ncbi:Autophagy-related protein 22-2 [Podosphaera aphanis]|nr:Autophagy-related protein 22-2 [Podosphaera aphanis]
MRPSHDHGDSSSHFQTEDKRLTTKKELAGWYAYSIAAEVFVICGIGSFIPIILEQLARVNGVLLSDMVTPCGSSSTSLSTRLDSSDLKHLDICVTFVFGIQVNTASFALYTFSLSVLFQALLVVSLSYAADHGNHRKVLLLIFAYGGSLATMLFLLISPNAYLLAALLTIISITCSGTSFVLLNSFLPLLVRYHPKSQAYESIQSPDLIPSSTQCLSPHEINDESRSGSESPLLSQFLANEPPPPLKDSTSVGMHVSSQISSTGIGLGYSASLFLQCILTFIIWVMGSTTYALQVALFLIGLWWAIFSIPATIWLRPRPGPPIVPTGSEGNYCSYKWLTYLRHSWLSLWHTFNQARKLKDITLFCLAWFLLSDAIATVSGTAILYAKTNLHMKPEALAFISIVTTAAGVMGAFTWSIISLKFSLKPQQTVLVCICIFEMIPLYGLLAYIPLVKSWGVFGLQQPWEMYPLGFIYGFVLGGLSSHCRAIFGELIPSGSEVAFYALYAVTDKGSSVFGPAIVGAIINRFDEIRPAFFFLAILIGLPGPIIWLLDVERGSRHAREATISSY